MSNRRKKNTEDVKNAEEKYTFGSREGKKFENITAIVLFFYFFMGYVHLDFSVKIETDCVLSCAFRVLHCFKARKSHLHFPHTSGLVTVG